MSIAVNYIPGAPKNRRLNEAFSVVTEGEDGRLTDLIDIIPASDIPGRTAADVEDAFTKAASNKGNTTREQIKADARARLGLALN